ncbi:MAG: nucleotidyl transferase AbiEii/AbiGii toxin family protein [Deltaproteobacteria bacterium]|nr:nucleotidyl transferase AbiEii/AbiGii toxin family protein [Deltaproteobacteria bacterium]
MIPQSQLSKLSNRLLKELGGRRIPEQTLERDYCIAWFLVGLSKVPLREKIAFKGGTALKRCHFENYRFSEDLDFTLLESLSSFDELKEALAPIYDIVKQESNVTFSFSRSDSQPHQNTHTFYLAYEGPLPATAMAKEIKVDVTIKESLVENPTSCAVLRSYPEFSDLPLNAHVRTYPLAEIAMEKTVALLDRARTEPRDLYDLWFLLEQGSVDLDSCFHGIELKLQHRGKRLPDVRGEFENKETRLRKTWVTRLSSQMNSLPEFDGVYRAVKRHLRQSKITAAARKR